MLWLRWLVAGLLLWRSGFFPRPVHMRFVVDKVALGQVSVYMIKFCPIIIQPFNRCFVLFFVFKLLLSEGQEGKAWEP
jgi:hypothetical protein